MYYISCSSLRGYDIIGIELNILKKHLANESNLEFEVSGSAVRRLEQCNKNHLKWTDYGTPNTSCLEC